ncbi:MAG: hypothetical protein NVSMB7_12720 [Chitinophagaceae bacterium]
MKDPKIWNAFAERTVSLLITALKQSEPVPEKLANYLNKLDTEEIRRYFLEYEKFDPLIIQINNKMYVFNIKHFIEDETSPLFEHFHIKLNSIL